jgi:hypothetical protein
VPISHCCRLGFTSASAPTDNAGTVKVCGDQNSVGRIRERACKEQVKNRRQGAVSNGKKAVLMVSPITAFRQDSLSPNSPLCPLLVASLRTFGIELSAARLRPQRQTDLRNFDIASWSFAASFRKPRAA